MTIETLTTQTFTEIKAMAYDLGYRQAQLDTLNLILAKTGTYISIDDSRLIAAVMKLPDTTPIATEPVRADFVHPVPEEIR